MLEMLERLTEGHLPKEDIRQIASLASFIEENSLCGLGQNAPNPVLSTLRHFGNEYLAYTEQDESKSTFQYFITESFIGCGRCKTECAAKAIEGGFKERHIIDQKKCVKSGHCFDICPVRCIEKRPIRPAK
jgi:Na+-translocating ferredoxin:NAD+ oxidoreductase RNF subunit RnfB